MNGCKIGPCLSGFLCSFAVTHIGLAEHPKKKELARNELALSSFLNDMSGLPTYASLTMVLPLA